MQPMPVTRQPRVPSSSLAQRLLAGAWTRVAAC